MSSYIEKVEKMELPVLVLSDSVVFPSTTLGLDVSNSRNAETATSAAKDGRMVLVVSTTEPLNLEQDNLDISRLYRVGVVSRIKQSIRTSVGKTKILVEGVIRASVLSYQKGKDTLYAEVVCKKVSLPDSGDIKAEAYRRKLLDILNNTIRLLPDRKSVV